MAQILVVDDNARLVETVKSFLELEGHTVRTATSAEAAIGAVGLDPPEVCLLDINMPGLDGFEICRRIKDSVPNVGVLIMSGRSAPDDEARSLAAGAAAHLTKPISLERLRDEIQKLLTTYHSTQ